MSQSGVDMLNSATTPVWLLRTCDNQQLAVVHTAVYRCLDQPEIIEVPTAREQFLGVIDWQGELVPVVVGRLREREVNCVLLLHSQDHRSPYVGVALSALPVKSRVSDEEACEPPDTLSDPCYEGNLFWWERAIGGIYLNEQVMPLVHPSRLLD